MNFKKYQTKTKLFSLVFVFFILAISLIAWRLLSPKNSPAAGQVCFSQNCVMAEISATPEARAKGLMFREKLGAKEGMLFIFDSEGFYSFWMKNTLLPLDIIWIDDEFRVVHIEEAAPCLAEDCPLYKPALPGRYVLEVNQGFAKKNKIKVGDTIKIDYPPQD